MRVQASWALANYTAAATSHTACAQLLGAVQKALEDKDVVSGPYITDRFLQLTTDQV